MYNNTNARLNRNKDKSTIWNDTQRLKWIFHADKKFKPPN